MSPYSRKTGKRYTAGSQATRGDFPANCEAGQECPLGVRIVMSHQHPLWFEEHPEGVRRSWHFRCHPLVRQGGG